MKQIKLFYILIALLLLVNQTGNSQITVSPASPGFDVVRTDIPQGKVETISYNSTTVGATRLLGACGSGARKK